MLEIFIPMITFCTTCKGRAQHLKETLPRNLAENNRGKFIVLDYNSDDDLEDFLREKMALWIAMGRLVVYKFKESSVFHMAHAKNMAARLGMLEGGDVLVTLDADNFAGHGFDVYARQMFKQNHGYSFLCPQFIRGNPARLPRGFAGRLAIRANDFLKAGGYNETFDTWRGEDIDLLARLRRVGLKEKFIPDGYLNAIMHGSAVRFKEWPDAQKYENNDIYMLTGKAGDTVVNFGQIGCGIVYRNFSSQPIRLAPLPTRIFGIGLQRTATTSLHEAFQILGFDSAHWKSGEWALAIWKEMHRFGRSQTLEKDYALCDNPIPLLYKKLDQAYPGSKFILTIRDEGKWLKSVERLWSYQHNPQRWTWDNDPFSHKVHAILYGQTTFDAEKFLAVYRRHNAEVREYFSGRPDDLLVMDIDARPGWQELCGFLDQRVPDVLYPNVSVTHKPK